jgi:hypothetical protein
MYAKAEALAFWRGVCAGHAAMYWEGLVDCWCVAQQYPQSEYLVIRFWLAVARLQGAQGWLK